MIDHNKVEQLVLEAIQEEGSFLIDYSVDDSGRILVVADDNEGITLKKLSRISRKVEGGLDPEKDDFAIEVTSPGVGTPFKVEQQYAKNVGRPVKVKMKDGKEVKGELAGYKSGTITLTWKEKVPKEKGKGKETVERREDIEIKDILETKLEIRF